MVPNPKVGRYRRGPYTNNPYRSGDTSKGKALHHQRPIDNLKVRFLVGSYTTLARLLVWDLDKYKMSVMVFPLSRHSMSSSTTYTFERLQFITTERTTKTRVTTLNRRIFNKATVISSIRETFAKNLPASKSGRTRSEIVIISHRNDLGSLHYR